MFNSITRRFSVLCSVTTWRAVLTAVALLPWITLQEVHAKRTLTAEQKAGVSPHCSRDTQDGRHRALKRRLADRKAAHTSKRTRGTSKIEVSVSRWHAEVALVYDDGSLLEGNDIDLCATARAYYSTFADDRHFLFIFGQGGKERAGGYNAYYLSYRNDVKGIGLKTYDRSAECGSDGVLLGLSNMNGTSKWAPYVYPGLDLWPTGVIAHEIGHQWVSHLDREMKGVRLSTPDGVYRSHWQPLVDSDASMMYGNNWRKVGKNKFLSTSFPRGYSNLDRYLMGVLPASDVKPITVINATDQNIRKHYATPGNSARGQPVTITMSDIQETYGARSPDYQASQKAFRAGFIMVIPKGDSAKRRPSGIVDYLRRAIAGKMKRATGKKMIFHTSLNCDVNSHCNPDQYCQSSKSKKTGNRCVKKKPKGQACTRSAQCRSGRCRLLRCR